jgi:hypothetical protein
MGEKQTSIRVSETPVWSYLHRKKSPSDTMDDVLRRELGLEDEPEIQQ